MRLRGKVALVTGAASGIGHAIAMLFSQEGARVAIADINDEAGRQTAIDLGGKEVACYIRADVSSEAEVRSLVEETVARFAAIDILVNNAAIVLFKRLVDTEPDEWDKVIATNLRSVYLCSRYTHPAHDSERSGSNCQYLLSTGVRHHAPGLELRREQRSYCRFDAEHGAGICQQRNPGQLRAAGCR